MASDIVGAVGAPCADETGLRARLRYCPWAPLPKQRLFLMLKAREAFYGGATGPGKSVALLMAALQFVDVPGYSALLLRRTYQDLVLPKALIPLSMEWLAESDAKYNQGTHAWTFPSGAKVVFGSLDKPRDVYRYQGAAFQFIGFDEATHIREFDYRYLFSRARRPSGITEDIGAAPDGTTLAQVPVRVRATANPGGQYHEWVYRRFVNKDTRSPHTIFIPGTLKDNPHLDAEEYTQALNELDPVTRERLLNGDWHITQAGAIIRAREWLAPHILDRDHADTRRFNTSVRAWDLAATEPSGANPDPDWTAGALMGIDKKVNDLLIRDVVRTRATSNEVAKLIRYTADKDGVQVPIVMEQEPGSAGKALIDHYRRNVLPGHTVIAKRATGSKLNRVTPLAGWMEAGQVFTMRGTWNTDLFDELDAFDGSEKTHDDQVDALSLAYAYLTEQARKTALAMPAGTGKESVYNS